MKYKRFTKILWQRQLSLQWTVEGNILVICSVNHFAKEANGIQPFTSQ